MTRLTADTALVRQWLASLLGDDLVADDDVLLEDLGWDSLVLAEVAVAAEQLGVSLPDELVAELRTMGDVLHYLSVGPTATTDDWPRDRVALVPVTAVDVPMLFGWFTDGANTANFRLAGQTPSPEEFHRLLWAGTVAQYLVCTDREVPTGLVSCFEADFRNGHAHLAAIAAPAFTGTGALLAGLGAFVNRLFDTFPFRKLYAEVLGTNLPAFASGMSRVFEREGLLRNHVFTNGAYDDLHVLSLTREHWAVHRQRLYGD